MRIFKNAVHSKIESAINLEIRGQIKINLDAFNLGHRDHMYAVSSKSVSVPCRALDDLTWNDPIIIVIVIVIVIASLLTPSFMWFLGGWLPPDLL